MNFISKLFSKGDGIERIDVKKRFDLMNRLGQGSMSRVWKAYDHISGRTVALKVLDFEKTQRFEARFQGLNKPNEGEIAKTMRHPNVVETYEFGWTVDDEQFLVMEFIEGVSLSLLTDLQNDQMRKYRMRFAIQIGYAVDFIHKQGWIHRDLCPRNILVASDNQIKIIDFGLMVPDTPDFRKPGNRTGTANYMAPELIKRQSTDQRIDIFSYAITCYEMFSGRLPWEAAQTLDAVVQHINKPPAELKAVAKDVDDEIHEIIMKGIATVPDHRWQTTEDMVNALRIAEKRMVTERKRARMKKAATAAKAKKVAEADSKSEAAESKKKVAKSAKADRSGKTRPTKRKPAGDKPESEASASPAAKREVAASSKAQKKKPAEQVQKAAKKRREDTGEEE